MPLTVPVLGLIRAPLHITAVVLKMLGVIDRIGSVGLVAALPIAAWELSLGIYLVVKGFKPYPITDAMRAASTPPAYRDICVTDANAAGPTRGRAASSIWVLIGHPSRAGRRRLR